MIFIKAVIFLSLLHIPYLQADKPDRDDENTGAAGTASSGCEQTAPATTYWTEWYSSSKSFTYNDRKEDFSHLCSSEVLDTECREKYTHRSLESLTSAMSCRDGEIWCKWGSDYICEAHDLEIRLLCNNTSDKLPEPDLHWSLSELDSGGTRGAVESWNCNDEVMMVNGTTVGKVVQGKSLSQTYGPQSHENLCGVQTNGNAILVFTPYVQNCLTSPDCCNSDHGISVMFWLRKNEMDGNHSRPQSSPLHVFRSPSLNATVQSGHFFVTYLYVNREWKVNTTLVDREWTHVTITFDLLTNLTVYLNGEAEDVARSSTTSLSIHKITEEFREDDTSFQVFSTEPGVTSSDIRPTAMTDLKIFFRTLSANLVYRTFVGERQGNIYTDAPPKVMRMAVSQKTFLSSITDELLRHIKLTCLIRSHDEIAQDNIHFLYKTNGGSFEKITSDDFYMMTSLEENNEYRKTAVAQIYGRRRSDLQEFFQRTSFTVFTCDVTTDNQLSVYGYETVESHGSTNLDDTRYYNWTRFYDFDRDVRGNEEETLINHLDMAGKEPYELPCQNPTYAECIAKSDSQAKQWYEVSPAFVPDFDYWCEGKGIRCTLDHGDNQTCPDLEVRYACPFQNATMSNGTEVHGSTTSVHNNGTRSRNESKSGSRVTVSVTDASNTSSTSSSTPVHDWTPSSEGDTDSVTTRKNPNGHDVTNGKDVNDRTPSSVNTSVASSPDTSTTRHTPDTSTSTGTADDSSTPDVASTSRPTDAMSTPGGTKAHVGAKGTSQTTVFNTRRTDYGGSTVSDTVVTSADTSRTTKPTVARPSNGDGGSSKATGNKKITITGNDSAHLNYLYPVMIVALGVGIPTLTACYYLCRKLTPEEIEERRLIEERKRKLEEQEKQTKPL